MGEGAPAQTPAPHHVQYSFNVVRYSSNSNRTTLRTAYCVLKISSFVGAVLYVHIRYTYGYTRLPCMAPMHASWMRIGGCIAIRSDDVCLTLTEYSGPVPSAATVAARDVGGCRQLLRPGRFPIFRNLDMTHKRSPMRLRSRTAAAKEHLRAMRLRSRTAAAKDRLRAVRLRSRAAAAKDRLRAVRLRSRAAAAKDRLKAMQYRRQPRSPASNIITRGAGVVTIM